MKKTNIFILLSMFFVLFNTVFAEEILPTYIISPQDEIIIEVWEKEDFTREAVVRFDGFISFPPLGDILAKGKTPNKLAQDIILGLTPYIEKPVITVSIKKARGNKITILGGVKEPGEYYIAEKISLLEAIGLAGGISLQADESQTIKIVRKNEIKKAYLSSLIKGEKIEENVFLENNDIILIPENLENFLKKVKDSGVTLNINNFKNNFKNINNNNNNITTTTTTLEKDK